MRLQIFRGFPHDFSWVHRTCRKRNNSLLQNERPIRIPIATAASCCYWRSEEPSASPPRGREAYHSDLLPQDRSHRFCQKNRLGTAQRPIQSKNSKIPAQECRNKQITNGNLRRLNSQPAVCFGKRYIECRKVLCHHIVCHCRWETGIEAVFAPMLLHAPIRMHDAIQPWFMFHEHHLSWKNWRQVLTSMIAYVRINTATCGKR